MRYLVIACEVLARPLYVVAARAPHVVDIQLMDRALHLEPGRLRQTVQAHIDAVPEDRYDAVLLGYALCSNGTAGLVARGLPLVIPKAHDCITLYLGSRQAYDEEFESHPGTYYYTADWLERAYDGQALAMGANTEAAIRRSYDEYVEKYGKENADYLIQVLGGWKANYSRAAFIQMGLAGEEQAEEQARSEASENGWRFDAVAGNLGLLHDLLAGNWGDDFLVVPRGQAMSTTYDHDILAARPLAQ